MCVCVCVYIYMEVRVSARACVCGRESVSFYQLHPHRSSGRASATPGEDTSETRERGFPTRADGTYQTRTYKGR